MSVKPLTLKVNDLQPYFRVEVLDSDGNAIDITGATIVCTMKNISTGTKKIDRSGTGINITDATNGLFEYRWQSGDTDTAGNYYIEFEVDPSSGGKFTIPGPGQWRVNITSALDSQ